MASLRKSNQIRSVQPVLRVVWAGVVSSDDDKHVLELWPDIGNEGKSTRFLKIMDHNSQIISMNTNDDTHLEYNCDYIVTNVAFAWKLLSETWKIF